jgi:hypothetical protein
MKSLADEWRCDASNATWIVDHLEKLGLAADVRGEIEFALAKAPDPGGSTATCAGNSDRIRCRNAHPAFSLPRVSADKRGEQHAYTRAHPSALTSSPR